MSVPEATMTVTQMLNASTDMEHTDVIVIQVSKTTGLIVLVRNKLLMI